MLRKWRHIRMAKRGGRSYDPTGIKGTSPRELAVRCPACPIPSINLPPDWQSVRKDSEYVNSLCSYLPSLTLLVPGISTTRCLALTRVSGLREDKSRTMRRTQSSDLGLLTSLRGIRTASTSASLPTKKRFAPSVLYSQSSTDACG